MARGGGGVCPALPVPGYRRPREPAVRAQPRGHPAARGAAAVLWILGRSEHHEVGVGHIFLCAMCIHLYYINFAAGTRGQWWNSTKTTLSLFLQSWGERRMMPTCPPSSRCPPATTPRSCGGTPAARRPSPRRTRCPCPGPCATSAPCWGGELWLQCTNWLSSQQIIVKINSKILYWEREAGKYCTMVLTYLL